MHAIWGLGMLSLTKTVVVVDAHVDVHDYAQVVFYVGANVDPARDVVLTDGPADHLDHATDAPVRRRQARHRRHREAARSEGAREWPPEIEMSAGGRELVDRRWAEYGLRRPFARPAIARSGRVAATAAPRVGASRL